MYCVLHDELLMPICIFSALFLVRDGSPGPDVLTTERAKQIKICELCQRRLECLAFEDPDYNDRCLAVSLYPFHPEDFSSFENYVNEFYQEEMSLLDEVGKLEEYAKRPYAIKRIAC